MKEETLQSVMKALLEDAEDYAEELAEMREDTTKAYNGDKYGNEMDGRSQIVTREVRDAVEVAKPAIMRILFGSNSIVEFKGRTPDDVPFAKQATKYVQYSVSSDPMAYTEALSGIDDALIRKTGTFKVLWETDDTPVRSELAAKTMAEIELISAEDDVLKVEYEDAGYTAPAVVTPEGYDPEAQPEPLYDLTIERKRDEAGKVKFVAIPCEELRVSRDARNFLDARMVAHVREETVSNLVQMGYDRDEMMDLAAVGEDDEMSVEEEVRSVGTTTDEVIDGEGDDSQRKVMYAECWVYVDFDDDGLAELRRVCCAGSGWEILHNELAEYRPIAGICPSPVAHQIIGNSLAELVEDIQRLKTNLTRNTVDSLANAIHPDTEAVENEVNFSDLLNSEQGRIIRVKRPGMVNYLSQPFIGGQVFPLMQYLDTLAEARTGMNEASQGLNADALQSTASKAIDNATIAAQSRIEFIARNLLETGLKYMFSLMLRVARDNATREQWIRVTDSYEQVDPRNWTNEMDVETTVALGEGTVDQRLMVLREIAAKQEQIIQLAGPDNPLAGIPEYRNTLADIAKMSGVMRVERYLKDPNDPQNQQPPQPPQPDPEVIKAQQEAQEAQAKQQLAEKQLQLDAWAARAREERERMKAMADVMFRQAELEDKDRYFDIELLKTMMQGDKQQDEFIANLVGEAAAAAATTNGAENQQGQ